MDWLLIEPAGGLVCYIMPRKQPQRIPLAPYVGFDSLYEKPLPNPSEIERELEIKKQENTKLRDRNKHLEQALTAAANLLLPYASRLNGRHD